MDFHTAQRVCTPACGGGARASTSVTSGGWLVSLSLQRPCGPQAVGRLGQEAGGGHPLCGQESGSQGSLAGELASTPALGGPSAWPAVGAGGVAQRLRSQGRCDR